jgi:ABC-type transport system substrate-binding protein
MAEHVWRGVTTVLVGMLMLTAGCQGRDAARQPTSGSQAPAAPAATAAKPGGTLTIAVRKEITIMNPLVNTDSSDQQIRQLMFEPLLAVDQKGNIQPYLAESWSVSGDGRVYTFKLRQGVRFHNGQEMTAEDAKFAIDYTLEPKNGAFGFSRLTLIERVEAPDRYTLRIALKRASPAFPSLLTEIRSFSVIPKGSLEEGVEKPATFPAGTGPFRFADWQPKQRLVFERFDDYWAHKAHVDKVVLLPISEDTVRFTALRAGDVDLVERTPYEWVRELVDGKVRGIGYAEEPYGGHRRVKFNVADPPFDNTRLRLAVAHAVDRRELLSAAFYGFGEPTDQRYPRDHAWYFDGVPSPAYDPEKARALVREAGYNGQEIDMLVVQSPTNEAEAVMLQDQLKRVGLNVRLVVLESGAWQARIARGEYAMMAGGGGLYPDPGSMYGVDFQCEADRKRRAANESGYCDAEMDSILRQAEAEGDLPRRKALFKQAVTRVLDDVPELYIGWVPRFWTFRDHVKGFTSGGDALMWWEGGTNYAWLDR